MINAIIIDDEILVAKDLWLTLEEFPEIKVLNLFTNAHMALEWLKDNKTDVVFTDIQMPGMDGLELAARLYETQPEIMIVFVTGYKQYAADSYELEAIDYLVKPIFSSKLKKTIEKINKEKSRRAIKADDLKVSFFGGFDISIKGESVAKGDMRIQLAAYLAHNKNRFVNMYDIFDILWPDSKSEDEACANRLRVYIYKIRGWLANCEKIKIEQDAKSGYKLVMPDNCCDIHELSQLIKVPYENMTPTQLNEVRSVYKTGYLANNNWDWAQNETARWNRIITKHQGDSETY